MDERSTRYTNSSSTELYKYHASRVTSIYFLVTFKEQLRVRLSLVELLKRLLTMPRQKGHSQNNFVGDPSPTRHFRCEETEREEEAKTSYTLWGSKSQLILGVFTKVLTLRENIGGCRWRKRVKTRWQRRPRPGSTYAWWSIRR
jgi:hypothetical protein